MKLYPLFDMQLIKLWILCVRLNSYYTSAGRNGPSPPGPTTPGPSPPGPSPPGELKTFNTVSKTNANSGGQMFTIKAKAGDITIKSFDIFGKKDSTEEVKIYTRQGSYEGHEYTESEWELIFDEDVELKKNVLSDLKGLAKDVTISAGLKQAFYIWSKKGMLYTEVKEKGVNFDGDDALAVYTGIAIKNLFQKVVGNAEFRGRIRYVSSFMIVFRCPDEISFIMAICFPPIVNWHPKVIMCLPLLEENAKQSNARLIYG